ncbi:MAG: acyl-CoA dehydrogenase family protein [Candidatus Dormibacteria bacterium]
MAQAFAVGAAERDLSGEPPRANLELARSRGVLGLTIPVEFGGWGVGLGGFARYQHTISAGDGSTALILAMHHMLIGGEAEAGLWPPAGFRELCESILREGRLVNSAATEPDSGSPSHGGMPKTRALRTRDNEFALTGTKVYTTGAPVLGYIRVSATVSEGQAEPYGARFLVTLPCPQVRVGGGWNPAALRASVGEDINLDQAPATFLYREDRRGCEGNVWFQVAIASTYLGIGWAAFRAGLEYTRNRRPAGMPGPVSDLDAVRLRLGATRGALMLATRNLLSTCDEWDATPRTARPELVSSFGLAKVACVNAAAGSAEQAVRLAGGAGLSRDLPLERYLRETRAGLAHPPVDDVAHLALARELLDAPGMGR